ncbi:hypothetical protein TorRG33x02_019590 [Trema orientale]|uniref:Transmembrane protein n=1 Tax=Trema orientale TaxID=63057 RepID=A0A2P5FWM6_TREOI|nr:hypothetical protein TorRG33x02_019590 [Trema orientale]
MPSKCLSKCSLLVLLVFALFLAYSLSTAMAGFSGRSGGRMGGSAFGPSPPSYQHSTPPSSSSWRGSDHHVQSKKDDHDHDHHHHPSPSYRHSTPPSFSGFGGTFFQPPRPCTGHVHYPSRSHFNYSPPPVSVETTSHFEPPTPSSSTESPPVSVETTCRFESQTPSSSTESKNEMMNEDVKKEDVKGEDKKKEDEKINEDVKKEDKGSGRGFLYMLFGSVLLGIVGYLYVTEPWYEASVLMVQVGLSGKAKSLQRDLNRIARSADTSGVKGFHGVLQETLSVLLQHHDNWISGFSYVDKKDSVTESEKSFNKLSLEERKKVDIESLVNFNGQVRRTSTRKGKKLRKKYIVVTVIVAARGAKNLPSIKTTKNLKTALQYLEFISLDETMAVEVLWTPQDEGDTLSEDDLLENYHHLRPI